MSVDRYLRSRLLEMASAGTRTRSQPLADWALGKVRLDGRPFSFEGHAFLRELYDDTSPHVVVTKAAQVGGTVWAILRAIHACLLGLNVMYLFPSRTDVIDFSKSRVKPLLEDNPFLARSMRDTDTAGLKRIGDAHLYLRGMKSPIGIKSVPADMIVFDELDEATPDAKTRARERLSHSSYKRVVELSNPSIPDYGIDEAFRQSDQRHWHLKCPACGAWTSPVKAFPTKLNQEVPFLRERDDGTVYRACTSCDAELDLEVGEWVPEFPGRTTRGYQISQLFSPLVDPGEILHEYRATRFPDRFYNLKIGIAWVDRANRLHADEVLALCTDEGLWSRGHDDAVCTMGVDTGRELHVVVSARIPDTTRRKIVYIGAHASFEDLDVLMRRFAVTRCVIDGLPETHATREFAHRHPGQVYLNFFNEHQRGAPRWDEENCVVQENRTEALDESRRVIRDREYLLPRRTRVVEEFARHLAADAKQLTEDEETGIQKYRYVRAGADHYSLALTYDCIASRDDRRFCMTMPVVLV